MQYPESIKHENADFDGYLFYVIDNTLHLLNTADDPMLMFKTYKCEAIRNYDDEQQNFILCNHLYSLNVYPFQRTKQNAQSFLCLYGLLPDSHKIRLSHHKEGNVRRVVGEQNKDHQPARPVSPAQASAIARCSGNKYAAPPADPPQSQSEKSECPSTSILSLSRHDKNSTSPVSLCWIRCRRQRTRKPSPAGQGRVFLLQQVVQRPPQNHRQQCELDMFPDALVDWGDCSDGWVFPQQVIQKVHPGTNCKYCRYSPECPLFRAFDYILYHQSVPSAFLFWCNVLFSEQEVSVLYEDPSLSCGRLPGFAGIIPRHCLQCQLP